MIEGYNDPYSISNRQSKQHDQSFATLSSNDISGGLSRSQRRMMTKNDIFADMPSFSESSTTALDDSNPKTNDFVGTFDENMGVLTTKTYQEMKKKGRSHVNLTESQRQYQQQNQALANMMPEDAIMVYGNSTDHLEVANYVVDYSKLEAEVDQFRGMNSKNQDRDSRCFSQGNDQSTVDQTIRLESEVNQSSLIDPSLIKQYKQSVEVQRSKSEYQNDEQNDQARLSQEENTLRFQTTRAMGALLTPVIERSFEQSEMTMTSSIGPMSFNSEKNTFMSMAKRNSKILSNSHSGENTKGSILDPVKEAMEEDMYLSKRDNSSNDPDEEMSMGLLEKIPVQKSETVIVVSSTVQERNIRRRRWTVLKVVFATLFILWLVWALFFVSGAAL